MLRFCSFISATTPEYSRLERALSLSKNILAYVNQAVKDCENRNKLKRLQSKIDRKQMDHPEFKVIIDTICIIIALLVLTIDILFFKNFDQIFIIKKEFMCDYLSSYLFNQSVYFCYDMCLISVRKKKDPKSEVIT